MGICCKHDYILLRRHMFGDLGWFDVRLLVSAICFQILQNPVTRNRLKKFPFYELLKPLLNFEAAKQLHQVHTKLSAMTYPEDGECMAGKLACAACGLEETTARKLLKCKGCKLVLYCSKACQKTHWKAHKTACKSMQSRRLLRETV